MLAVLWIRCKLMLYYVEMQISAQTMVFSRISTYDGKQQWLGYVIKNMAYIGMYARTPEAFSGPKFTIRRDLFARKCDSSFDIILYFLNVGKRGRRTLLNFVISIHSVVIVYWLLYLLYGLTEFLNNKINC